MSLLSNLRDDAFLQSAKESNAPSSGDPHSVLTMITLASVVLSFVLVHIVGNRVLQGWQRRTWLHQQQFLGSEREYLALLTLFEEIASLSGKRIYRMRRLLSAILLQDADLAQRRSGEYDEILVQWNESLNSFIARLTFYAEWSMAYRLETDVQREFVRVGAVLNSALRTLVAGSAAKVLPRDLNDDMNKLQGMLVVFNRDMLRSVEKKREHTYYGMRVFFSAETLELFSTWELLKALSNKT